MSTRSAAQRPSAVHDLAIESDFGYWQGTAAAGLVHVAGQVGRDTAGRPVTGGLTGSFEAGMANLRSVLDQLGVSTDDLVAVQLYVPRADLDVVRHVASLHRAHLGPHGPATSIVPVVALNHPDYHVEIAALAVASPGERMAPGISRIDGVTPLEREMGGAAAVMVGGQIHVACQLGTDDDGALVGAGLVDQLEAAIQRVERLLTTWEASLDDVVASTIYVARQPTTDETPGFREVHRGYFGRGDHRPTVTRVEVPSLPHPGALVGITVTAVVR